MFLREGEAHHVQGLSGLVGLGSFLEGAEEEEGRCEAGTPPAGEAPVPALWPCQRPAGEAEVGARVGADRVEGPTRAAVHQGARAGVPGGATAAGAAPGAGPGPRPGGEHVRRPGVVWRLLAPPRCPPRAPRAGRLPAYLLGRGGGAGPSGRRVGRRLGGSADSARRGGSSGGRQATEVQCACARGGGGVRGAGRAHKAGLSEERYGQRQRPECLGPAQRFKGTARGACFPLKNFNPRIWLVQALLMYFLKIEV